MIKHKFKNNYGKGNILDFNLENLPKDFKCDFKQSYFIVSGDYEIKKKKNGDYINLYLNPLLYEKAKKIDPLLVTNYEKKVYEIDNEFTIDPDTGIIDFLYNTDVFQKEYAYNSKKKKFFINNSDGVPIWKKTAQYPTNNILCFFDENILINFSIRIYLSDLLIDNLELINRLCIKESFYYWDADSEPSYDNLLEAVINDLILFEQLVIYDKPKHKHYISNTKRVDKLEQGEYLIYLNYDDADWISINNKIYYPGYDEDLRIEEGCGCIQILPHGEVPSETYCIYRLQLKDVINEIESSSDFILSKQ